MGEDELESTCRKSLSRTCNAGEFKCSNNQCIPKAWVCDGAMDCSNDEDDCRKYTHLNALEKFRFSFDKRSKCVCIYYA